MRVGQHIPVDQPIILESLPTGWSFPLYMDIMIYELNVSPYNVIYKAQSAYGSDWPDYNPGLVIPDLGNFFFDVATGNFEEEEPPPEPEPAPPCSISISAPDSAEEGALVSLSATITNNSPYAQMYKTEMYAGIEFIGSIEDTIPGYSSRTYGGSFIMPAGDVTILVWVERWTLDKWVYDNAASKDVSLTVAPTEPEFRGFGVMEYTRR